MPLEGAPTSLQLPAWPIYEMLTPGGRQAYGSLPCWTLTPLSCCRRYGGPDITAGVGLQTPTRGA